VRWSRGLGGPSADPAHTPQVYALRKREKYAEAIAKCREALGLSPSDAAAPMRKAGPTVAPAFTRTSSWPIAW